MPAYEYKCSQCGHRFDKLVRASDEKPYCPLCHSQEVERLPSWGLFSAARDWSCGPTRYT